ncbi:MAG: succinate dehydrogenase, hydrophobic membrane anchor protein, partial [Pseudomonadota bacterium]
MTTSAKSVRGLGSAGTGTQHHIRQRVTALALIFLVPWFLYSIIHACKAGYEGALIWVAQPINAILLILTLSAALYHMRLGMQVVIEDYLA